MKTYLDSLQHILDHGTDAQDRTGIGTRSVFGIQMRFDLSTGFPAVTTKKLAWRAVVGELLWFLEGSDDVRRLSELTHGVPDQKTIWHENVNSPGWQARYPGTTHAGAIYGVQWRRWGLVNRPLDQIAQLIAGIQKDPQGRRHIITAWNPDELDQMCLPPCHVLSQFYVRNGKLSCQMYQRSGDFFLGIPFNIASYSLLTHMIAQVCELQVGDFVHTIGDAHIYHNHVDAVREQLSRTPYAAPTLWINPDISNIDNFKPTDFRLENYQCYAAIKAAMAV